MDKRLRRDMNKNFQRALNALGLKTNTTKNRTRMKTQLGLVLDSYKDQGRIGKFKIACNKAMNPDEVCKAKQLVSEVTIDGEKIVFTNQL